MGGGEGMQGGEGVQGGEGITEKPCISSMHLAKNADIGVRGGGGHQIMM